MGLTKCAPGTPLQLHRARIMCHEAGSRRLHTALDRLLSGVGDGADSEVDVGDSHLRRHVRGSRAW